MADDLFKLKRERWPYYLVGCCVAICFALLVTGTGILLNEEAIRSDATEMIEVSGITVPAAALAGTGYTCTYFSGRGVVTKYFNSFAGVSQCPFLSKL